MWAGIGLGLLVVGGPNQMYFGRPAGVDQTLELEAGDDVVMLGVAELVELGGPEGRADTRLLIAQAGLVLAAALVIIGARWAGPIRHVAEGLAAWVPVSLVLFVVGNYFGREAIHTNWLHGPPVGKEAWLSFGRVFWTGFGIPSKPSTR